MLGAGAVDQGTPPAAAGEQRRAGGGEQGDRPADGEHRAGIRQAVDDHSGILLDVQCRTRFLFTQHLR